MKPAILLTLIALAFLIASGPPDVTLYSDHVPVEGWTAAARYRDNRPICYGDGIHDDTECFQWMANNGGFNILDKGTYLIQNPASMEGIIKEQK